jgi:hypothetical protein
VTVPREQIPMWARAPLKAWALTLNDLVRSNTALVILIVRPVDGQARAELRVPPSEAEFGMMLTLLLGWEDARAVLESRPKPIPGTLIVLGLNVAERDTTPTLWAQIRPIDTSLS